MKVALAGAVPGLVLGAVLAFLSGSWPAAIAWSLGALIAAGWLVAIMAVKRNEEENE